MSCRLLYVVGQLHAGGLERQLCYLLSAIDRERYSPAVVVWRFREEDIYVRRLRGLEVPIYFFPSGSSGISKLGWIRSLARKLTPEVIHSYSFYTNFGAWYAAEGIKAVSIGSVRSDFARAIRESGLALGRLCARWPRSQIFNSFTAAESARTVRGPFAPRDVYVVRNALDLSRFTPAPLPNGSRVKVNIIAIGSLIQVKRWDRLLNAAHRLKHEGFDFVVKIAGDGSLRNALSEQVKQLGLEYHVEFIGQTEEIPALLAEGTVFVHTSDSEGCPNVVMEAMACGRPVVATDAGDTRFLIEEGKTGFVVRREDSDALADRIASLISDRALSQRMGDAGRIKAEQEFGLDRLVDETLSAYRTAGWQSSTIRVHSPSVAA